MIRETLLCVSFIFTPLSEELPPDQETAPEESTEEEQPTIIVDGGGTEAAQMIIDYLEQKDAEKKAEEEQKAKEEAEALEKAQEEEAKAQEEAEQKQAEQAEIMAVQASLDATYTSNTNVVYGYANRYRYYLSYDVQFQEGYYTRTNKYIYCWPEFTTFEYQGGQLKASQDGIKVSALYSGQVSTEDLTEPIKTGGLLNAYSNIDIVDYPSLYQINKSANEAADTIINYSVMLFALVFGCWLSLRFIDG